MDEAMQEHERRVTAVLASWEGVDTRFIEAFNKSTSRAPGLLRCTADLLNQKQMLLEMMGELCRVLSDMNDRLGRHESPNMAAAAALKAARESITEAQNEAGHSYKG
jgi:hypothetical protein